MRIHQIVTELVNKPYRYEMGMDNAMFYDTEGNSYYVRFDDFGNGIWAVAFQAGIQPVDTMTGRHDSFRVLATVVDIIKKWMASAKPATLVFGASLSTPSRVGTYNRLATRLTKETPYVYIPNSSYIADPQLRSGLSYMVVSLNANKNKLYLIARKDLVKMDHLDPFVVQK